MVGKICRHNRCSIWLSKLLRYDSHDHRFLAKHRATSPSLSAGTPPTRSAVADCVLSREHRRTRLKTSAPQLFDKRHQQESLLHVRNRCLLRKGPKSNLAVLHAQRREHQVRRPTHLRVLLLLCLRL